MKFSKIVAVAAFAFVLLLANGAHAQTYGTMPALYNSTGGQVNGSGTILAPGTYYLQSNGTMPVTYFGDGTYYNPSTNTFGGSVYDPTGVAGLYTIPVTSGTTGSVGIPNTGAGGNASANMIALAVAGLAAVAGAAYLVRSRHAAI